ncbi:hypothetical protein GCM10010276_27190 [Streptomyces longisporus]|uniref:Uncharacterized protein n=1 Tax=Streptomyces longisporus TaxID=1948 RepID=A0ABN3LQ43_STRLO
MDAADGQAQHSRSIARNGAGTSWYRAPPTVIPRGAMAGDTRAHGQGRFDLTNVVPQATLEHLGAAVSKSPFDLVPADATRGVRVRTR